MQGKPCGYSPRELPNEKGWALRPTLRLASQQLMDQNFWVYFM